MSFNMRLVPVAKTKSLPFSLLAASPSIMSEQIAESTSQRTKPNQKLERTLAWQIAPNLFISFKYAWAGLKYAFVTQRNFRIHTVLSILAISLGAFLHISTVEMAVIGIMISLVLALELLNTALESVVDLTIKQTYHELAKIAKDCAAGAVLVSAMTSVFVAGLILLPPLLELIF